MSIKKIILEEINDFKWIQDTGKVGSVSVGDKFVIYPGRSHKYQSWRQGALATGAFTSWDKDEYFVVQITDLSDKVYFTIVEYHRNVGDRKGEEGRVNWETFDRVTKSGYWTPIS